MTTYEPVIGLEIHIQLNTRTKVFCPCPTDSWGAMPNTHICPVCTGLPGVLPVLNQAVVVKAVRLATAMQCTVNAQSFFDRKNYFYPDLPKGYQITQYDQPIGLSGQFEVPMPNGSPRLVTIHKMHIEEDAGKTKNDTARGLRLIDMNRCGVPLIEMVTGPDLRSAEEAAQFLIRLRQLLRWLDISDANMERAHVRCDANVSIRPTGSTVLNPKTEIKNVNSIEAVKDAIEKEIERQIREVTAGRRVEAWTLDWDEETQTLRKMRSKETEADYRYFREPDLLSVVVSDAWRNDVLRDFPELPLARRARFIETYKLSVYDATLLTEERGLSDYFEQAAQNFTGEPKVIANWVLNEIMRYLNEQGGTALTLAFTPRHLAELAQLVEAQTITRQTGVTLIPKVMATGQMPSAIVEVEGLGQISGDAALRALAQQVIHENPKEVDNYRKKPALIKWFVGQVMRKSQGKANAQGVEKILVELLEKA